MEQGIEVMDWPPYSPDLNPIENLWKRLKDEIIQAHPELITMGNSDKDMAHLIDCAREAWETLAEVMLNKLALSMQKRVDAVKAANGWYTCWNSSCLAVTWLLRGHYVAYSCLSFIMLEPT